MTRFTPTNRSMTPHLKQKTCVKKKKKLDSVMVSRERKEKEKKGRMKKMAGSSFVAPTAGLDLVGHRDPQLGLACRGSAETQW
jgi:hypothetical protein